jgi:hypothetical protein
MLISEKMGVAGLCKGRWEAGLKVSSSGVASCEGSVSEESGRVSARGRLTIY